MMTRITPKLLTDYHLGNCTPDEMALVERWLRGEDVSEGDAGPVLGAEEEAELARQLWVGIGRGRNRIFGLHLRVAAAALLLFACSGALALGFYGTSLRVIDNMAGESSQMVRMGGLEIEVPAGSSCTVSLPWFGREGRLRFAGAVSVTNPAATGRTLRVCMGKPGCERGGRDRVYLTGGQRYLAMDGDDCQLLSATRDELADGVPMGFKSKLTQRFML